LRAIFISPKAQRHEEIQKGSLVSDSLPIILIPPLRLSALRAIFISRKGSKAKGEC